jgi:transposase
VSREVHAPFCERLTGKLRWSTHPYYRYTCIHALCNAHHLRELIRAFEQDGQQWAKKMEELLLRINKAVDKAGGVLSASSASRWRQKYRAALAEAEIECPAPAEPKEKKRGGRIKRSKARNLLERLKTYESDVLRFTIDKDVPFTNNQGERDIRMTKVQQKISGCFRSIEGAKAFCLIRSYMSTCQKQEVTPSKALNMLFHGEYPEFIQEKINELLEQAE